VQFYLKIAGMASSVSSVLYLSKVVRISLCLIWLCLTMGWILPQILLAAYEIRLHAIKNFGRIIHEFDPYFNFRATEYLYEHGWQKFATWFDYMSWYPLGRPVGTTIYPGMQVTAVFLKRYIVADMSLNDVCVFIPVWFGVFATLFTGLLAYECSAPVSNAQGSTESSFGCILSYIPVVGWIYDKVIAVVLKKSLDILEKITGTDFGLRTKKINGGYMSSPAVEVALCTSMIMAIVPAHLMRSIGGGYDNESIAMAAMTLTFWLWTRSLRCGSNEKLWPLIWGTATGVAYFYMVAAWGGYVFVLNLIGCHAAVLILLGRYSSKLHCSYSAFYFVGTALAIQVPVVGWTPLKSLEQLAPCGVFIGIQLLEFVEWRRRKNNLTNFQVWELRLRIFIATGCVVLFAALTLAPTAYFGPISARVRGLFVKHTKTGNPLVDSVAEHQPASYEAYLQYLGQSVIYLIPVGFLFVALRYFNDSSSFLLVYACATYYFSLKMVRLVLLTAPIASALAGIVLGHCISFFFYNIFGFSPSLYFIYEEAIRVESKEHNESGKKSEKNNKQVKGGRKQKNKTTVTVEKSSLNTIKGIICKVVMVIALYWVYPEISQQVETFYTKNHMIAEQMSHPTILQKGTLKSGETVTVDDYRECYWWLRDETPPDARVLAWWDYGYQLTAIANRTTIADGNTWNHEHIALLGRVLTSPEKEGHRIARHLADYVLIWAGGGGDDLAKSPHLARIANSVYRSMCPGDPICSKFGMTQQGPSKMMRESFLFKLHGHRLRPGVEADPNRFQEVYQSKYGKCRIFKLLSVSKESKDWVADPKNRICDAPGSWYCRGQYPPALQKVLAEKKDFSQLEDFNKKDEDTEYQQQYFENLKKKDNHRRVEPETKPKPEGKKKPWKPVREVTELEIKQLNTEWEDNAELSMVFNFIQKNELKEMLQLLRYQPEIAHMRSSDGRGPMWWAHEFDREKFILLLKKLGVRETLKDSRGISPLSVTDEL